MLAFLRETAMKRTFALYRLLVVITTVCVSLSCDQHMELIHFKSSSTVSLQPYINTQNNCG